MADKSARILMSALSRAALAPHGTPLFASRTQPGLFPSSAAARRIAEAACRDGLIRRIAADPKGKADADLFAATNAGLEMLRQQADIQQVLEDLARTIDSRQVQIAELMAIARQTQAETKALKQLLEQMAADRGAKVERQSEWFSDAMTRLSQWEDGGAAGDYPLSELYRELQSQDPSLTIGRFHDGLRELHDRGDVYLHPWTGPLHALPEPAVALLIGHEIAYYASLRNHRQTNGSSRRATGYRMSDAVAPIAAH